MITHALARGASVRLVGDDCQLGSISAGGVLRDIAATTDALTLSELVRFTLRPPKALPPWRSAPATPPASASTSTTTASMSAPMTPPPTWPTPRGPPTSTPAETASCWPPPTTSSTPSTPAPAWTGSPPPTRKPCTATRSSCPTDWRHHRAT